MSCVVFYGVCHKKAALIRPIEFQKNPILRLGKLNIFPFIPIDLFLYVIPLKYFYHPLTFLMRQRFCHSAFIHSTRIPYMLEFINQYN